VVSRRLKTAGNNALFFSFSFLSHAESRFIKGLRRFKCAEKILLRLCRPEPLGLQRRDAFSEANDLNGANFCISLLDISRTQSSAVPRTRKRWGQPSRKIITDSDFSEAFIHALFGPQATLLPLSARGRRTPRVEKVGATPTRISSAPRAGADRMERQKNLQFDKLLLDSHHALVFTHEWFTTIRIASSSWLWGQPTNADCEEIAAIPGGITCAFTPRIGSRHYCRQSRGA
jgi:hypothetical protein